MRMVDIIQKKKKGEELTTKEINFVIKEYSDGNIPDYQMSAFLMAVYFQGMNKEEIADLTMAIVNSGDKIDLSKIEGIKVDKHSTGGVGDKISLIVVPLVASVDVPVAKISGRGLGHTGGTIDKLESIEGFNVQLRVEEFIDNVNKYKMAIVGQTSNLTPADKKLYALRDVTATVDSIPLIASSIMSKKIASGADAIVLDVKVGSGAFMKSVNEAKLLAETMVNIGKSLNKKTIAIISNMDQPLGHEVGNSNEIKEAIEVLKGKGSEDETTVALTIASHMAVLGGAFNNFETAYRSLIENIKTGKALKKFKELIKIQGGNEEIVDFPNRLPKAKYHFEVKGNNNGYISSINAEEIGIAAMLLGAGRKTKEDNIDFSAGITILKKYGDEVKVNDTLCILHSNKDSVDEAIDVALKAFKIDKKPPKPIKYVYDVIQ